MRRAAVSLSAYLANGCEGQFPHRFLLWIFGFVYLLAMPGCHILSVGPMAPYEQVCQMPNFSTVQCLSFSGDQR
jgi:hypothetical protein